MLIQMPRPVSEREYHLQRKQECERMALDATSPAARIAHEMLASEHARRARRRS